METIKRKNSKPGYREMYWQNGKCVKSPVFDKKSDCVQWLAQERTNRIEAQLYGDMHKFRQKITMREYSECWVTAKKAQGIAKSSEVNYESYLRRYILPTFGNRDLKSIQKQEIESFQAQLRQKHNPKGTNVIMTMVRSLFRGATLEGYLMRNPCEFVKRVSEDSQYDKYWTKAEIDQFLKVNQTHESYDLFLVAMNTGMRRGELAALCWDRVDFDRNTITVSRTRDRYGMRERTKTNIRRVIPMNSLTRATLFNIYCKRKMDAQFVFLTRKGTPIDPHHLNRTFNRAQRKAGIGNRIKFHDLRHTFASQFTMDRNDVYDLQKLLGHTNISMTTKYAHLSIDHLQNAVKDFGLGQIVPQTEKEFSLD